MPTESRNAPAPSPRDESRPDIASLARMKPRRRGWLWLLLLAALALGGFWFLNRDQAAAPISYDTQPVERGDLVVSVIATGTVQPTTRVEISSELSGTISAVEADFNATVTEGQVLARLDDTKLRAQVSNAEAQLAASRARLSSAEATVTETADALSQAEALDKRGLNTRSVIITARAGHERALASVEIAKADVVLAEANLASNRADLEKAVIRSPIDGVVLSRSAERGQIVAASLNAPVLFTLAEDLTRMELRVSVDEADIGRVAEGQEAAFTVDAWPGRRFDATITSIRYAPDESDSVVSYTAVLSVQNDDLLLRPGMTATATITVSKVTDTLKVPVAALRYAPPVTASSSRSGQGLIGLILPSGPPRGTRNVGRVDGSGIWVLRGGQPTRISITPGATDGSRIAVTSGDLREDDEVILGQRSAGR